MVTVIPLNEEEKASIIKGLRSAVPATKLVTLKRLVDLTEARPESFQYMDMYDKRSLNEIITSVEYIVTYDMDEVIKREAMVTLEKVKRTLGIKFFNSLTLCNKCNNIIDVGWEHCAHCGTSIENMVFEDVEFCKGCSKPVLPDWVHCTHCGIELKKKEDTIPKCRKCRREVDPTWLVCPFCGAKLR
ncbi:RNA polymerase subunit RPABC4/transcription elongation factor Spt4 [Methanococcus voltae]|uniref:double zinc ribbon domain-containing protein n=1 Tax=Methanococcus voltae TaxID=2188 RepID=UPI001AE83570|nr:zinc ribbon domain-containing protein [Methanococcus voltae]MBP2143597.1 RNA polymerase subunit RPABC4/transcription elongation factor Spt4 [Methanococcus voltae]